MSKPQTTPSAIWNPAFVSIVLTNMLMFLSQQMINVLIPKFVSALGATPSLVGFTASAFAYTALLMKIFSAPAIDTFNKKYVLAIAMVIMAIAYIGYGFSTSIKAVLAFRLLQGAGQAFSATCCLALASDSLPSDRLGTGIGYFSLAQAICQSVGPALGLMLANNFGYKPTFFLSSLIMIIGAITALQVKNHHVRSSRYTISITQIIAKEAILSSLLMFFLNMAYYNVTAFLVLYAGSQGISGNIGLFFTVYAITLLFSRPLVGRLSDPLGTVKVLIPALVCFSCAFILISMAHSLWMLVIAAIVSAFGYGTCQPVLQAFSMKCVPKQRRGAGSTTNYIGQDIGNLVGPVVAGLVIEHIGWRSMWVCMTLPVFIAMGIVLFTRNSIVTIEKNLISQQKI